MRNSRCSALRPPTLGSDFHKQPLSPSVALTVVCLRITFSCQEQNRITVTEAESRLISLSCEIGVLAFGASKYLHFRRSGSSDGGHPICIPSSRVKVSTAEWGRISDIGGDLFSNSCRRLHVSI